MKAYIFILSYLIFFSVKIFAQLDTNVSLFLYQKTPESEQLIEERKISNVAALYSEKNEINNGVWIQSFTSNVANSRMSYLNLNDIQSIEFLLDNEWRLGAWLVRILMKDSTQMTVWLQSPLRLIGQDSNNTTTIFEISPFLVQKLVFFHPKILEETNTLP